MQQEFDSFVKEYMEKDDKILFDGIYEKQLDFLKIAREDLIRMQALLDKCLSDIESRIAMIGGK